MHRKKDDGAEEQAEQEKTGASSGCGGPTTDMQGAQQVGGGLGYMSGCVPGQLAPERRPTSLRNDPLVTREGQEASGNQGSQGLANDQQKDKKRWRRAWT